MEEQRDSLIYQLDKLQASYFDALEFGDQEMAELINERILTLQNGIKLLLQKQADSRSARPGQGGGEGDR